MSDLKMPSRFAVLRGDDLPEKYDGLWLDLDSMDTGMFQANEGITAKFVATTDTEQRGDDGECAIVYRLVSGDDT